MVRPSWRQRCRTESPSSIGRPRSSTTASYGSVSPRKCPSSPSCARSTTKPAASSVRLACSATRWSSSTIRIRMAPALVVVLVLAVPPLEADQLEGRRIVRELEHIAWGVSSFTSYTQGASPSSSCSSSILSTLPGTERTAARARGRGAHRHGRAPPQPLPRPLVGPRLRQRRAAIRAQRRRRRGGAWIMPPPSRRCRCRGQRERGEPTRRDSGALPRSASPGVTALRPVIMARTRLSRVAGIRPERPRRAGRSARAGHPKPLVQLGEGAPCRRDGAGERPAQTVVRGEQPGADLCRQNEQEQKRHPAAERIVTERARRPQAQHALECAKTRARGARSRRSGSGGCRRNPRSRETPAARPRHSRRACARRRGSLRFAGDPRERHQKHEHPVEQARGTSQTSTEALEGWWERMIVVLTVDWISAS